MISPAKRHLMRVKAAQEAAKAAETQVRPDASQYELMLAKLYDDKRRLRGVESMKTRAEMKREMLPEYAPYLTGILQSDAGVQDDVLTTTMLWCIDAGEYNDALDLAEYAMRHNLTMADSFSRSLPCLLAEQFAEAVLKNEDAVPANVLYQVGELTLNQDMPDQVKAKLHKAIGTVLLESDPKEALTNLQAAYEYDERSGVKTQIKKLEKQLQQNKPDSDSEPA
ncbi:phage terminase small subunit [Marinobacterium stanieri]|uniref:Phage small terminase subunit n=1 Tax=Marinobacterium stanieri TaxID=49186 RepID=A0A1N6Q266_9GAMM|nr:phage terminase small subunit [Marinobacterium stanieri]SIQ10633.1 Phage small terminase subunit [Marinobacterium stanieri]